MPRVVCQPGWYADDVPSGVDVQQLRIDDVVATGHNSSGQFFHRVPLQAAATTAAAYTVKKKDFGGTILASTDAAVVTLPLAADHPGAIVRVINAAADDAALISISPQSADSIRGTVAAVSASGTANKDWQNTKSGANRGDYTVLQSDGLTSWYIIGGVGVWASEA